MGSEEAGPVAVVCVVVQHGGSHAIVNLGQIVGKIIGVAVVIVDEQSAQRWRQCRRRGRGRGGGWGNKGRRLGRTGRKGLNPPGKRCCYGQHSSQQVCW